MSKHELHFTERMSGHIAFDDLGRLVRDTVDQNGWVAMKVEFQMHVDDVTAFWNGTREGEIVGGAVKCDELGECIVKNGTFRLMYPIEGDQQHQHMSYHVHFIDGRGHELTLNGYKEVVTGGFNPFEDTTATLTRIEEGWLPYSDKWSPGAIASGVLRISAIDSVTQVFTFRSARAGRIRGLFTTMHFVGRFFRALWKVYGFHGRRRQALT